MCIYPHELDIDKMKEIVKFCHDNQNRNGHTRVNREQNAFNTTGQVPRVLAESHAASGSGPANMSNAETIPQIAMFINESYMTQPPPAQWPPLPPPQAAGPAPSTSGAPPPPPAVPQRLVPAPPTPQAQKPPPAPSSAPLPPSTATHAQPPVHRLCPTPNFAGLGPNPLSLYPMSQRLPMVPLEFDASRPPPPLPTQLNQNKRKIDSNGDCAGAGPSKTSKECPEVQDGFCESCLERKRRILGYKVQMDILHNEEEMQILRYKKKLQEYEMGRNILKSLVEPDLFMVFDDLIEGVQTPRESITNYNSANPSFVSAPSTSREDDTQAVRRLNLNNYSNQSPDLINLVIETFRNSNTQDSRSPALEVRSDRLDNNRNCLNHLANGQKPQHQTPSMETSRYGVAQGYTGAGMMGQEIGAHAVPSYPVAGPSGYGGAGPSNTQPPPASSYLMYHPSVLPPPNRHNYAGSNASRTPVPGPSQGMPSTSSAPLRPAHPNNYNQMGRQ